MGRLNRPRPGTLQWRAAALAAAIALAATACATTTGTPAPTIRYTAVPIAATPWPHGTTGKFGLHIDPALLARLPSKVDGLVLVEDATSEGSAMNDADLAKNFDGYAAASIGLVGDANWLNVAVGRLKDSVAGSDSYTDFYLAWVNEYASGACSQADGVADSSQQTINDWLVDVSHCKGAISVYSLPLGSGILLSMYGMGSRDMGRKLIAGLSG